MHFQIELKEGISTVDTKDIDQTTKNLIISINNCAKNFEMQNNLHKDYQIILNFLKDNHCKICQDLRKKVGNLIDVTNNPTLVELENCSTEFSKQTSEVFQLNKSIILYFCQKESLLFENYLEEELQILHNQKYSEIESEEETEEESEEVSEEVLEKSEEEIDEKIQKTKKQKTKKIKKDDIEIFFSLSEINHVLEKVHSRLSKLFTDQISLGEIEKAVKIMNEKEKSIKSELQTLSHLKTFSEIKVDTETHLKKLENFLELSSISRNKLLFTFFSPLVTKNPKFSSITQNH